MKKTLAMLGALLLATAALATEPGTSTPIHKLW